MSKPHDSITPRGRQIRDCLPETIHTADQVREIDRRAIEELGIPSIELMERAGRAALGAARRRWPNARTFQVFCGAGNNAGDGYVFARLAKAQGLMVHVEAIGSADGLTAEARQVFDACVDAGVAIERPVAGESMPKPSVADELMPVAPVAGASMPKGPAAVGSMRTTDCDVIVDALLGIGLKRDVAGAFRAAVERINAFPGPVLALDVPSGLDADRGEPRGIAVHATATMVFVGLKQGLFLGQAPDYCGEIEFAGLDLPPDLSMGLAPTLRRLVLSDLRKALPRRARMAHKRSQGRVLLVGGGPGMGGAIRLAAEAALRVGAGLVQVATDRANVTAVLSGRPELLVRAVVDAAELEPLLEEADAVVLGPGLGQSTWARALWSKVIASDRPLVLDADGLNLLAASGSDGDVERRMTKGNWVLTPHAGEAGRLLDCGAGDIQADRLEAVQRIVQRFRAVVVLKGACTLIGEAEADADGRVETRLCDHGNPGMATAGTGDVLAGTIGGLLAQLKDLGLSARTGVLLHALAGDDAAIDGERGLVAGDLLPALRRWANPC